MSQCPYRRTTLSCFNLSTALCCSTIVSDFSNHSDITVHTLSLTDNTVTDQTVNNATEAVTAISLKLKQLKQKLKTALPKLKLKTTFA